MKHWPVLTALVPVLSTMLAVWARSAPAQSTLVEVHADQPGKAISPDLFGIFFEDLNDAADGGLYAEMVQNRSFDYAATEQPDWNALTGWQLVERGSARGSIFVEDVNPLNPNHPTYLVLRSKVQGDGPDAGAGIVNSGFDGMAVKAGEKYRFSVFARKMPGSAVTLQVRLESADGTLYAAETIQNLTGEWAQYTATLAPTKDDPKAQLVILDTTRSGVFLDMVSLFPQKTFHNRPNGLRADLAQTIADLHPRFVRFPGGCLAHGDGIKNIYRWKDTIGPVEQRAGAKNIWRYHQTHGLGYFEYFQFCEDIGAAPVPVVAAGVSCQNSDLTGGLGQQCIPMQDMAAYTQDILDLVEYANGPATSTWGAKRAEAGHPEPFHLKYLGIGNEDAITPGFRERFTLLLDAVRAKYPDIVVIGTVGPAPLGRDFEEGWKLANQLSVPMVDEHYYMSPVWFLSNMTRYDAYDRAKSKVYVGEYAAHDVNRLNTLRSALAEAAYMTSLERNGDVVHLASYAPLLAKQGHTQWRPDLIYFTNTGINPSINYYVQQMFMTNGGDAYLSNDVKGLGQGGPDKLIDFACSSVRDSRTGDIILKFVNIGSTARPLHVDLSGLENIVPEAEKIVLSGDPMAVNTLENSSPLVPQTSSMAVAKEFDYEAPPSSLTVIRIKTGKRPNKS